MSDVVSEEECDRLGVQYENRWEEGVPHHPKAQEIYEMLSLSDMVFMNDYFCWKSGGDGDNGETMMYALSVLFELRDAQALEKERSDG